MRCDRAQELFSDYCEGTVQTALLIPLESHLDTCADCQTQLHGLRDVWTVLDRAPVVEPPADFRSMVWRRIETGREAQARRKRPAFSFDWKSLFARPNLGWAAAGLVVLALAPIAMPGAHIAARLGFPFGIGRAAAGATGLTVGQPHLVDADGGKWLDVAVNNTGKETARITATVVTDSSGEQSVEITALANTNKTYRLAAAPAGAHVTLSWMQSGGQVSHEYALK